MDNSVLLETQHWLVICFEAPILSKILHCYDYSFGKKMRDSFQKCKKFTNLEAFYREMASQLRLRICNHVNRTLQRTLYHTEYVVGYKVPSWEAIVVHDWFFCVNYLASTNFSKLKIGRIYFSKKSQSSLRTLRFQFHSIESCPHISVAIFIQLKDNKCTHICSIRVYDYMYKPHDTSENSVP